MSWRVTYYVRQLRKSAVQQVSFWATSLGRTRLGVVESISPVRTSSRRKRNTRQFHFLSGHWRSSDDNTGAPISTSCCSQIFSSTSKMIEGCYVPVVRLENTSY